MKLISWNVNGIRAVHNKGLFVPFMEEYKPDILCLQETKAQQHQSEVNIPGYEEYWNSAEKKGYSGTAIFVKTKIHKEITNTPLAVLVGLPADIVKKYKLADDGYGDPSKEGRVIAAEFEHYYVVTVYTPNSKEDLSRLQLRHRQWDPAFLEYIKLLEKKKPVIFCGDLNVAHKEIDLANPKANVGKHGFTDEEREGIDKVEAAGLVDTFRYLHPDTEKAYSWWSHFANSRARNVGWRIDYFFASKSLSKHIKKAEVLPQVLGSDHCPVLLEVNL